MNSHQRYYVTVISILAVTAIALRLIERLI